MSMEKKWRNLQQIIRLYGKWWNFYWLQKIAEAEGLEIPCRTTICRRYNLKKRVYDYDFHRYTRYDGEDLHQMYADQAEFEAMTWEEKIQNYLVGNRGDGFWEEEYPDEYDYWFDNGTEESIQYSLGEEK